MAVGYVIVASGATVSPPFAARGAFSIWVPPIATASLSLLGSFNTTSANFVSVRDPSSPAAAFLVSVGSGNCVVPVGEVVTQHLKLQLSAATTAPRSFAIIAR